MSEGEIIRMQASGDTKRYQREEISREHFLHGEATGRGMKHEATRMTQEHSLSALPHLVSRISHLSGSFLQSASRLV
jgi:hypothetical protein